MALTLSAEELESAMGPLFKSPSFSEADFDRMRALLRQRPGKMEWSLRPRHYAVLRMINRLDLMQEFVEDGLKDIAFPYKDGRLPDSLANKAVRFDFLEKQRLVLTKAKDLETAEGRHRHFDHNGDDHFELERELGRGAFGIVHHVRSKLSRDEYARKKFSRKTTFRGSKEIMRIFENELSTLKRLSYRHLVRYEGSYTDAKYICLLTSPVADCDLRTFISRAPIPHEDTVRLREFYGCICSAVVYLHANQIRHKDLKPANILVKHETVVVTDFGTALDWSELTRGTTSGLPTSAYTHLYAAPEVFEETKRDESSDLWSLGCVFLDMSTALNGKTMKDRNSFLERNGSGHWIPAKNLEGVSLWLNKYLIKEQEQQTLPWILALLKEDRHDRIQASSLMQRIHSDTRPYKHFGPCCVEGDDSSDETSYRGSTDEADYVEESVVATTRNQPVSENYNRFDRDAGITAQKRTSRKYEDSQGVELETSDMSDETVGYLEYLGGAPRPPARVGSSHHGDRFSHSLELNHDDRMLKAAQTGDTAALLNMILMGADINAKNAEKRSCLHLAVAQGPGHMEVLRLLISNGIDVNAQTEYGETALHIAAMNGFQEAVSLLLRRRPKVSLRILNVRRAVYASHRFKSKMNRSLGMEGALKTWTALSCAALMGHVSIVQMLIDAGSVLDGLRPTALYCAVLGKEHEAVRMLSKLGAKFFLDCRPIEMQPLALAVQMDGETMVRMLLDHSWHVLTVTAMACAMRSFTEWHGDALRKLWTRLSMCIPRKEESCCKEYFDDCGDSQSNDAVDEDAVEEDLPPGLTDGRTDCRTEEKKRGLFETFGLAFRKGPKMKDLDWDRGNDEREWRRFQERNKRRSSSTDGVDGESV